MTCRSAEREGCGCGGGCRAEVLRLRAKFKKLAAEAARLMEKRSARLLSEYEVLDFVAKVEREAGKEWL